MEVGSLKTLAKIYSVPDLTIQNCPNFNCNSKYLDRNMIYLKIITPSSFKSNSMPLLNSKELFSESRGVYFERKIITVTLFRHFSNLDRDKLSEWIHIYFSARMIFFPFGPHFFPFLLSNCCEATAESNRKILPPFFQLSNF